MKSQSVPKVITIHPVGTEDICAKFHGNPSNSRSDILVWTKVVHRPTGQRGKTN